MTDKNAIKVVSGLLQKAPVANSKAAGEVDAIIKKYPYFIPARYIRAAQTHRQKAFSSEMLSAAYPYRGNWLMFLDHIQGVKKPVVVIQEPELVEEISVEEDRLTVEEEVFEVIETPVVHADHTVSVSEISETEDQIPVVEAEDVINENEPVLIADNAHIVDAVPEEVVPHHYDTDIITEQKEEQLFTPAQSDDYFMQQGIKISRELPDNLDELAVRQDDDTQEKSLMVMMSFTEWLLHFKTTAEKKNAELEDQKAVRTMWQKEKLSAALEEENDEIPENVFEMAVNSIAREEGLASESLADIYMKQGKYDQAIEMYKKLSLRNPQKNAYFARKIEEILKEKRS